MRLPKYYWMIVFCWLGWVNTAPAQMPPRDSIYYYSIHRPIPTESLLGEWQSADSLALPYSFTCSDNGFECRFLGYYFHELSPGNLKPQGYIPNWPPYNCWISFNDEKTITLYFYTTGLPTSSMTLFRPEAHPDSDN